MERGFHAIIGQSNRYMDGRIMKALKPSIAGIIGLIYGFLGIRWLLLSIALVIPDCRPGTKDWGDYTAALPFGLIMLFIFIVASVAVFIEMRKRRTDFRLFYALTSVA